MLTERQLETLTFIARYIRARRGVAPTFEEIRVGVGLQSKSQAHCLVRSLQERGFLEAKPNLPRAIRVLSAPEDLNLDTCPLCGGELPKPSVAA